MAGNEIGDNLDNISDSLDSIANALFEIANALNSCAFALEKLGVSNRDAHAIDVLSEEIRNGLESVADAVYSPKKEE